MDSTDLTPQQCQQINDRLAPIQRYLHALHERVRQNAFPPQDKVRQLVEQADNAVHALRVELHYLSVEHGVGRRERRQK
jgi:hypothetical protein